MRKTHVLRARPEISRMGRPSQLSTSGRLGAVACRHTRRGRHTDHSSPLALPVRVDPFLFHLRPDCRRAALVNNFEPPLGNTFYVKYGKNNTSTQNSIIATLDANTFPKRFIGDSLNPLRLICIEAAAGFFA
jgi:hypothetical protein